MAHGNASCHLFNVPFMKTGMLAVIAFDGAVKARINAGLKSSVTHRIVTSVVSACSELAGIKLGTGTMHPIRRKIKFTRHEK